MDIKTDAHHTTLRQRPLIFLDIEATGLEIQKNEIIEIGALKVSPKKPFKILDELNLKVKPKHIENADKAALKIVGFTVEKWQDAIDIQEALKKLDDFAEEGVIVGYNVNFDWAILDKAYFEQGRQDPFYYHRLDVMPMAYVKLFNKRSLRRFSLGEIARYFGIKERAKHQALDDARTTYQIFKKLLNLK